MMCNITLYKRHYIRFIWCYKSVRTKSTGESCTDWWSATHANWSCRQGALTRTHGRRRPRRVVSLARCTGSSEASGSVRSAGRSAPRTPAASRADWDGRRGLSSHSRRCSSLRVHLPHPSGRSSRPGALETLSSRGQRCFRRRRGRAALHRQRRLDTRAWHRQGAHIKWCATEKL